MTKLLRRIKRMLGMDTSFRYEKFKIIVPYGFSDDVHLYFIRINGSLYITGYYEFISRDKQFIKAKFSVDDDIITFAKVEHNLRFWTYTII